MRLHPGRLVYCCVVLKFKRILNPDYEKRVKGKAKLRQSNLCGNSPTGDLCDGDGGSGLTVWNEDIQAYELIGVVSFGIGCNSSFDGKKGPRLSKYY